MVNPRSAVSLVLVASTLLSAVFVTQPAQGRWRDNSGSLKTGPSDGVVIGVGAVAIGLGVWALVHHHRAVKRRQSPAGAKTDLPFRQEKRGWAIPPEREHSQNLGESGRFQSMPFDSPFSVAAPPRGARSLLLRETFAAEPDSQRNWQLRSHDKSIAVAKCTFARFASLGAIDRNDRQRLSPGGEGSR